MKPTINNTVMLPMSQLETNNGQIEGLPKNPRLIKGDKFKKLKQSIADNPEMLSLRELLVYPIAIDRYVIIGGNMRFTAMQELKYTEVPCKVIPETATVEQLKAYTIKDNSGFGEWDYDLLNVEWDVLQLDVWGVDMPSGSKGENPYVQKTDVPIYEIKGEQPLISDCIDLNNVEAKCAAIDKANITDQQKTMLKACAYRFAEINFANMAEYYAHQDKEMQELMESLALVIVDFDKAIELGLVNMDKKMREIYLNEK